MNRKVARVGAVTAAATLSLFSIAPAFAATVSQAEATALTVSIAGNPADSGTVQATNDGSGEKKTGTTNPPVDVLNDQGLLNIGVLAQQATARVTDAGNGTSAACAGVAGEGGSVAQVGSSNCITPGEPIGITIGNLNLTGVEVIDPDSALGALGEALNGPLEQLLSQLTTPITEGIQQAGVTLELVGTLGAVEARCTANPGSASGSANIADSTIGLRIGQGDNVQEVNLVTLPASPEPNTEVLVELDDALNGIIEALETDLRESLRGALEPLTTVTDQVQKNIIDTVVAQIAPQLQPLQDNLLKLVLNEQNRSEDSIEVTALSLDVLPAAKQFTGSPLVSADIAHVACGPNGVFTAPEEPVQPEPEPEPKPKPEVPTVVASGVAGETDAGTDYGPAALLFIAVTAGLLGYRRSLGR